MRLIVIGAPGAGKGTQAEALSKRFHIPTISTGEMIRKEMREQTPFGLAVKPFMDKGELIPDEMIVEITVKRISEPDCVNGYILDGFPRTVAQAEASDVLGIMIDYALVIEVSDDVIIQRLSGRRQCPGCGATYHIMHKKPLIEGICDVCGTKLTVRSDDEPTMVKQRLSVYHLKTEPLEAYYANQSKLRIAKGKDEVAETTIECLKVLGVY